MELRLRLLVVACFALFAFGSDAIAKYPLFDLTDVREVRKALPGNCPNGETGWLSTWALIHMGEQAFPAYEAILSDPKTTSMEVGGVFSVLGDVEADRRRFAKYAVSRLTDERFGTRYNAVLLLEEIGSPAEASPVVALLTDERPEVISAAASTLASIGGPTELVAMEVWLRGVGYRDKPDIREGVRYHRDKLKKRLDDAKDPKKRAQKCHQGWKDLTGMEEEVLAVRRAVRELTAGGPETVSFLKDRLYPVPLETQKQLDHLLADLDSNSFDRREAATRELSHSVVAESVLLKILANRPSPELRSRLETILEDLPKTTKKNPELLRSVRAIWVLQQIGTPEAQALLEKLAAGAPSALQTQKAKAALASFDRLKKR